MFGHENIKLWSEVSRPTSMKLKQREIFCRYLNSSRGGTQIHVSALDHSATQFHAKYNYFCSITSQETFKEPGTLNE
jgi:hypothetical protein